ncbi:ammonium transporter 2 [Striga asiatica]|uniref:Ammonium transporter 2 n=1 Tax=Striga asiatica TaxID=4170 RepID=A0A5A7PQU0_STRAF|nr:ammonium transporter 2 [Striga asiatica]
MHKLLQTRLQIRGRPVMKLLLRVANIRITSPFAGIGSTFLFAFTFRSFSSMLTSLVTGTGEVFPRLKTRNWAGPIFFPPLPVLFPAVSIEPKQPFTMSSM